MNKFILLILNILNFYSYSANVEKEDEIIKLQSNEIFQENHPFTLPKSQNLEQNNQVTLPESQNLEQNNQVTLPESQNLEQNNQVILPESQNLEQNNQVILPESESLEKNNQVQTTKNLDKNSKTTILKQIINFFFSIKVKSFYPKNIIKNIIKGIIFFIKFIVTIKIQPINNFLSKINNNLYQNFKINKTKYVNFLYIFSFLFIMNGIFNGPLHRLKSIPINHTAIFLIKEEHLLKERKNAILKRISEGYNNSEIIDLRLLKDTPVCQKELSTNIIKEFYDDFSLNKIKSHDKFYYMIEDKVYNIEFNELIPMNLDKDNVQDKLTKMNPLLFSMMYYYYQGSRDQNVEDMAQIIKECFSTYNHEKNPLKISQIKSNWSWGYLMGSIKNILFTF